MDIDKLLQELTTEEKVRLLSGRDFWQTNAIPRLNIPSIRVSDGPNGLRGTKFFESEPSACFPCGTAMGSTFDHGLMQKAGEVMAREAKAKGAHVILGPTVNIQRSPLGGRGFESYSEDPLLSGETAAAVINGMQSRGIQATIKHFVGNDQEDDRRAVNALIPERALREIYLKPFQLVLQNSTPGCFMSAYNKVNGEHVAQSKRFLDDILRQEWGFDGLVMSDWFGTYSTREQVVAGNNLEMPGPTRWRGSLLSDAVGSREVKMNDIDKNVKHVLQWVNKCMEESGIPENAPEGQNNTEETAKFLRQLAADSVVLLKNEDSALPLKKNVTTCVIGSHATEAAYCGGGSASLNAYYTVAPLDAITEKLKQKPYYAQGFDPSLTLPLIGKHLKTKDGETGFSFKCYDGPVDDPNRKCVDVKHLTNSRMFMPDYHPDIGDKDTFYVDLEGCLTPDQDGEYEFGCIVTGTARVYLDDKEIIDNATHQRQGTEFMGTGTVEEKAKLRLKAGKTYKYTVKFGGAKTSQLAQGSTVVFGGGLKLGWKRSTSFEEGIQQACDMAKKADQVVLCLGLTSEFESEGRDREHMDLPKGMDFLAEQVLEVSPNAVVVLQSGTPVTLPWACRAKGILQAWYGGNECGNGIADVLFGDVNPSGKLSLSWPKRVEDNPAFFNFRSENGVTVYGENVFVGYRYYEKVKRDVLFPFGHGLSYTKFGYGQADVKVQGDKLVASVDVTNKGKIAGKESVQFYVAQESPSVTRPEKELKAFTKLDLQPGESKTANVSISLKSAVSYWDDSRDAFICEQGDYYLLAASASDKVQSKAPFKIESTSWWTGI